MSVDLSLAIIISKSRGDWEVSKLESVRIGKGQKLLGLESVRTCLDWKVSETAEIRKGQKFLKLECVRNCTDEKCQGFLRLEGARNFSDWKVSKM